MSLAFFVNTFWFWTCEFSTFHHILKFWEKCLYKIHHFRNLFLILFYWNKKKYIPKINSHISKAIIHYSQDLLLSININLNIQHPVRIGRFYSSRFCFNNWKWSWKHLVWKRTRAWGEHSEWVCFNLRSASPCMALIGLSRRAWLSASLQQAEWIQVACRASSASLTCV